METLKFYTRPNCPLCNEARDILEESDMDWEEINILDDPGLRGLYQNEIPVIHGSRGEWRYRDRDTMPLDRWLHNME